MTFKELLENRAFRQYAVLAFLLAACSLAYEFAIAKTLSVLTGNAIVWESVSIGTYIASLGIGTWACSRKSGPSSPWRTLWRIELLLAIVGAASILAIYLWHISYRIHLYDYGRLLGTGLIRPIVWFGVFSQAVTIAIGFLSGYELPCLFAAARLRFGVSHYGNLFGFHYFGALAGTLVFAHLVIPHGSAGLAVICAAGINMILVWWIWKRIEVRRSWDPLAMIATLVAIIAVASTYPQVFQLHLKNFYYNTLSWESDINLGITVKGPVGWKGLRSHLSQYPDVVRINTGMQAIDILELPAYAGNPGSGSKPRPASFSVALDGAFQFNSVSEREYHEHMTHVPSMLYQRPPNRALVLGGGDGLLVREILRYGQLLSSVTLVEIDPGMLEFSSKNDRMIALNEGALQNPKLQIVVDDAFAWLRTNDALFDVIYIDFPYPFHFDTLRLYSVEFLQLVAKRLLPDGYIVMDVPLDLDTEEFGAFNDLIYNTVAAAGFKTIIAFQSPNETFITATKGLPSVYPSYIEYGFTPQTVGPEWFKRPDLNMREIRRKAISAKVNSIVRPRWLTEGNPRF